MKVTKHQCILLLFLFLFVYLYLSSFLKITRSHNYLIRRSDIKFVSCNDSQIYTKEIAKYLYYTENSLPTPTYNPEFSAYNPCNNNYYRFRAYLNESQTYLKGNRTNMSGNKCWSSFDYLNGISRHLPKLQRNVGELLNRSCVDYNVRSFVNVDNTNESLQLKCASCALVFSSGRLIHSNLGAEIDSHQCVIRLNNAPVKKYEHYVGSRTTLRVIAHNALYDYNSIGPDILSVLPALGNETIAVWDPPNSGKKSGKLLVPTANVLSLSQRLSKLRPNMKVFYSRSEYFDNLWLEATGTQSNADGNTTWISTGFYAFVIAMQSCNEIHVYGLSPENLCETSTRFAPYHYYPSLRIAEESMADCYFYRMNQRLPGLRHLFVKEQNIFREWAKQRGNIYFVPIK